MPLDQAVAVSSLMGSLDRGNFGNAKLLGLNSLLGSTQAQIDTNYSTGVAAFYITYIVCKLQSAHFAITDTQSISQATS